MPPPEPDRAHPTQPLPVLVLPPPPDEAEMRAARQRLERAQRRLLLLRAQVALIQRDPGGAAHEQQ